MRRIGRKVDCKAVEGSRVNCVVSVLLFLCAFCVFFVCFFCTSAYALLLVCLLYCRRVGRRLNPDNAGWVRAKSRRVRCFCGGCAGKWPQELYYWLNRSSWVTGAPPAGVYMYRLVCYSVF